MALKMTRGNVDDRIPVLELTKGLTGIMAADKGYIKQNLFLNLYERGLTMVHGIKKNMANKGELFNNRSKSNSLSEYWHILA